GAAILGALAGELRRRFRELVALYDNTASLQDRTVGTGILKPELARRFGCGGYVGRASARSCDTRRSPGYPPYSELQFDVPVLSAGDVDARVWVRIREVEQSLELIGQILAALPDGQVQVTTAANGPRGPAEGMALVEAFRGDVMAWVRIGED